MIHNTEPRAFALCHFIESFVCSSVPSVSFLEFPYSFDNRIGWFVDTVLDVLASIALSVEIVCNSLPFSLK
jgi:hypothetical protein